MGAFSLEKLPRPKKLLAGSSCNPNGKRTGNEKVRKLIKIERLQRMIETNWSNFVRHDFSESNIGGEISFVSSR